LARTCVGVGVIKCLHFRNANHIWAVNITGTLLRVWMVDDMMLLKALEFWACRRNWVVEYARACLPRRREDFVGTSGTENAVGTDRLIGLAAALPSSSVIDWMSCRCAFDGRARRWISSLSLGVCDTAAGLCGAIPDWRRSHNTFCCGQACRLAIIGVAGAFLGFWVVERVGTLSTSDQGASSGINILLACRAVRGGINDGMVSRRAFDQGAFVLLASAEFCFRVEVLVVTCLASDCRTGWIDGSFDRSKSFSWLTAARVRDRIINQLIFGKTIKSRAA
jgi:hypothetical protein